MNEISRPDAVRLSPSETAPTVRDIEQLCDRFEGAWKAGQSPRVESFLGDAAAAKDGGLLQELVLLEIAYRVAAGERLRPEEYQARFPGLDPPWIANALARENRQLSATEVETKAPITQRVAAPTTAQMPAVQPIRCPHCHNPIQLADNQSDEVLCPGCGSSFRVRDARQTTSVTPMKLGKYALLERVGLGAFGAVWRAQDTELGRVVALKIPHAGLAITPEELQRVYAEARKVALLRHPRIVTVHEVATLQGLPVIVSDFIQGVPLSDLLEVRRLTFRETAKLVAEIAEALDYAHGQGVVHRDMKPANVLVETGPAASGGAGRAEVGQPLILDFGLALQEQAAVTMTMEGQIIGTPAYMSPEQAAGKGHLADRRSDVFSLGVVLYELLCAELPFRGSRLMMLAQVRFEEPRPPRKINDKIPRDLETICLKCLQKDPGRRYPTALALTEDLRLFLKGEPIRARPVGRVERVWRWCRRNPRVAILAGTVLALLVLLAAGSMLAALWINRERHKAEENFVMACAAVDQMLTEVGQEDLADAPYMDEVRRGLLEKALSFYRQLARQKPVDPAMRKELARASHRLGDIYKMLAQTEKAKAAYGDAIHLWDRLIADYPQRPGYRHYLAISHGELGELMRTTGDPAGAAGAHYLKALDLQKELVGQYSGVPEYRQELARTYNNRSLHLAEKNRLDDARVDLGESIIVLRDLVQRFPNEPDYQEDLARSYQNRGNLSAPARKEDAEKDYLRSIKYLTELAKRPRRSRNYRHKLAMVYVCQGNLLLLSSRLPQAHLSFRRAEVLWQALAGEFPSIPLYRRELANSYNSRGVLLGFQGRPQEGGVYCARASEIFAKLVRDFKNFQADEWQSLWGMTLGNRAWLLLKQNERDDLATALEVVPALPPAASLWGLILNQGGTRWLHGKNLLEARDLLEEAVRHHRQALGGSPNNPNYNAYYRDALKHFAETLLRLGKPARAAQVAARLPHPFPKGTPENDRAEAYYLAAAFLARCSLLAETDPLLAREGRVRQARAYSEQAVRMIDAAVRRGFADTKRLMRNEDFTRLVSRADFQKIVRQLTNASKEEFAP